jgi:hypothetical protein
MSIKKLIRILLNRIKAANGGRIIQAQVKRLTRLLHQLLDRHNRLMRDRAAYRAQIAATAAALVALVEMPGTWATLNLAVIAIYVASCSPNQTGWLRAVSGPEEFEDEG